VVLDKTYGAPRITKDGVTVAKEIEVRMDCIKSGHRARQGAAQDGQQAAEINGAQIDGCYIRMIVFPDADARHDVEQVLSLDADASELLWQRVSRLVDEITRHTAMMAEMAQGRNRKERLRYIDTLSKLLKKLEMRLMDRDPDTDALLRRQLGERLGELLSHRGFEQLIQTSPGYRVGSRFPSAREDISRDDGLYEAYEQEMLPRRVNLGEERAPRLLIALVRTLHEPLARFLEIERKNKGGSPGKLYRNYVIQELAPIYQHVHGEVPTTTHSGDFVTMCDSVLGAIGLETDGVEQAAARILKRLKTG
jgi:hypothetical protein